MKHLFTALSILLTCTFSAQNSKFISFDLMYLDQQEQLTPSQKIRLNNYINSVISYDIVGIFLDTSISKANSTLNQARIENLREHLTDKNIDPFVISTLNKPKVHSEYVHNFSDEFDLLRISISYTSTHELQKIDIPQPKESMEKTMLLESGFKSTTTATEKVCTSQVTLPLLNQFEMTLNYCDYEDHASDIVFNTFEVAEMSYFKNLPVLNKASSIIGAYDFTIKSGKKLSFQTTLKIPIEKCINKQELTLFYCKDSSCQLVAMENIYSPEDEFITFKTNSTGLYFLIYFNKRKEYDLVFKLKGKYTLDEVELNTRCQNITQSADIHNKKAVITITESYYEPTISIKASDRKGRKYQLINKPLSTFSGDEKIKDFRVFTYYSTSKEEHAFPVYKKYKIKTSDLKLVRDK